MRYNRARGSLDRHATDVVAAYLAGAAREGTSPGIPPGGSRPAQSPAASDPNHQAAVAQCDFSMSANRRYARPRG